MVLSSPPLANKVPAGLNAMVLIASVWPSNVCTISLVSTFHNKIELFYPAIARIFSVKFNDKE